MKKKNKKEVIKKECKIRNNTHTIITSIMCIIPFIIGIISFNRISIPFIEELGLFNSIGTNLSKAIFICGIPLLFIIINILINLQLDNECKSIKMNSIAVIIMRYLIPILEVLVVWILYSTEKISSNSIDITSSIVFGLLFIIFGIFLPMSEKNYTIGYVLPWTMENDEVWYKTHLFARIIWIIGGFALLSIAIWPIYKYALFIIIAFNIFIPMSCSYLIYKNNNKKKKALKK